jgi:hypothetical protein
MRNRQVPLRAADCVDHAIGCGAVADGPLPG